MKKLYFNIIASALLTVLTTTLSAQTTHDVTVSNMQFTPASLNIEVGDIVRWTNAGGFHSVDGSAENWPNNPLAFGNAASSDAWEYEFTFTEEGEYSYWCGIHTDNMLASITVGNGPNGIDNINAGPTLALFPNPVVNTLIWKWSEDQTPANTVLQLFNVAGKMIEQVNLSTQTSLDVSNLSGGIYYYSVTTDGEKIQSGKLLIEGK